MNEENTVLLLKTVQISPLRNLITAIKDILTDSTITYTKNGMKIINFDKTHTILVNVMLYANNMTPLGFGICVDNLKQSC